MKKKNDPSNASLLKLRPLDSYSANRLNDIRASFIQAEQGVMEVNSQLDAQLEKKYESRRQAGKYVYHEGERNRVVISWLYQHMIS